jgi:hypothetical protein
MEVEVSRTWGETVGWYPDLSQALVDEAFVPAWGKYQSPSGFSGAISTIDMLRVQLGRVFNENARLHWQT